MIQSKYIVNPFLNNDQEEPEENKEEKQDAMGTFMTKKMEKLFLFALLQ